MKNFHLFLVIGAALQMVAHGAPITNGGVCHTQYELCKTPACIEEAENIIKYMKDHEDPCHDFERFACGGFLDQARPGEAYMDDKMDAKTDEITYGLVKPGDPYEPKPDPKDLASIRNIQRMHNNFVACMDETQHSKVGLKPLMRQLDQVVQLYPVQGSPIQPKKAPGVTIVKYGITGQFLRNSWTTSINLSIGYNRATGGSNKNDLSAITGYFLQNGLTTLIKLSVKQDYRDPKRNLMYVKSTSLGLPAQDFTNDPGKTREYEKLIGEMFYILYEPNDPATEKDPPVVPQRWQDVAKLVVDFEKKIAEYIPDDIPNSDEDFEGEDEDNDAPLHTIAEMNGLTSSLDWNVIFKKALPNDVQAPKEIAVPELDGLKTLENLLTTTDPKTIQLFFAWSMIRQFSGFLDAAHRREIDRFKQNSNGAQLDKAATCYKNTLKNVPDIVGHFYVETTLPKRASDKAEEIVNAILGAYSKSFQPNKPNKPYDWLKDDTRKGAFEKIKNLAPKIGYSYSGPDDRNSSSIDQFYSGLKLDAQDHFGNQVRAKAFWAQIKLGKLYKDVDRMHMLDKAPKNNADYMPTTNSVNIPAGDLQSPLFNVDFPEYLNYGGFGATTAGHEITHGLDNHGITYDETGRRSSKWFDSSLKAFKDHTQCLVDQYSQFTIEGSGKQYHNISGTNTLGENIADNGGINKAYEAWFERYQPDPQSTKYNNKRLPGLEKYTPEQMFFVQYARAWCTKPDPDGWKDTLDDVHSPKRYRIIGVLQNSQDFANAFKCQPGSYMNPIKAKDAKCKVW
ncbi:MAG: hypothetical protein J3Q66DRAFT_434918 [Benniella sp.]|nr:MAG: hypothetical protein J3Q66DRAFT_434918 [Benniella sp.]